MGCDIHSYAERKVGDHYERITEKIFDEFGHSTSRPFSARSYGVFGFLCDVRNYSEVPPIADPRGWPKDASASANEEFLSWGVDAHTPSWLSVEELAAFDYDRPMEDKRVTRQLSPNLWDCAATAEDGEGRMTTFRDFLGEWFFNDLDALKNAGADRVVFFFDN